MSAKKLKSVDLPLPVKKKRIIKQNEIDEDLVNAVERARAKHKMTWTQAVVYGLQTFLIKADPDEAARLGIAQD